MTSLMHALDERLEAVTERAGLELTERAFPPDGRRGDVLRLEYRSTGNGMRRLLLDFCLVTDKGTIAAALWSPDDLRRAAPGAAVDAVARRYRVWRLDVAADEGALVREIVATVAAWLQSETDGSTPV
jgi:hypothetical protein